MNEVLSLMFMFMSSHHSLHVWEAVSGILKLRHAAIDSIVEAQITLFTRHSSAPRAMNSLH